MSQPRIFVLRSVEILLRLIEFLRTLRLDGEWEVVIRKYDPKRTDEQNSLAWVVTGAIADQVWPEGEKYQSESWWRMFKRDYFGPKLNILPDGSVVEDEPRSNNRGRKIFSGFLEYILKFAAENNVELPEEAHEYRRNRDQVF